MWNSIEQWLLRHDYLAYPGRDVRLYTKEDMERAYDLGKSEHTPRQMDSEAQRMVNRALAHYCEYCDRGFSDTGACKMHKRFKHKNG